MANNVDFKVKLGMVICIVILVATCHHTNQQKNEYKNKYENEILVRQRIETDLVLTTILVADKQEKMDKQQEQIEQLKEVLETPSASEWKVTKAVATAYSPLDNVSGIEAQGSGHTTSVGLSPGPQVIAVDPNKVPYGSQMLIVYPDGSTQQGIAGDTGGALRAADYVLLDIFKYTYQECENFGRKDVVLLWKPKTVKNSN